MCSVGSFLFLPDGVLCASRFRPMVSVLLTRGRGGDLTGTFSTLRWKWHRKCVPSRRNGRPRTITNTRPGPCIFRIRESSNPREKDLVLVKNSARRHKLPCLCLCVHKSATVALRALLSSAHSRLRRSWPHLIPNRLSYPETNCKPPEPLRFETHPKYHWLGLAPK